MVIHTFGDSHSKNGFQNIEGIAIHHLGSKLCYSVGRDGIDLSQYKIHEFDTLIFCFGEIDCRCHVKKHISATKTYQSIIDEMLLAYFQQIKLATEARNVRVCIYNVVPPSKKEDLRLILSMVTKGTDDERKSYVLYFNDRQKALCKKYGFLYFDVYDKYVNEEGFINRQLSDDNVHVRSETHLRDFILHHNLGPIGGRVEFSSFYLIGFIIILIAMLFLLRKI